MSAEGPGYTGVYQSKADSQGQKCAHVNVGKDTIQVGGFFLMQREYRTLNQIWTVFEYAKYKV